MNRALAACSLAFFLLLTGCLEPSPADPVTGYFVDTPVSGLGFRTPSFSGLTGTDGSFTYRPGEMVTFYVGDTVLGTARAREHMSPLNLVPNASLPKAPFEVEKFKDALYMGDIREPDARPAIELANQTAFLQSLDRDKDPSNGVDIDAGWHDLLEGVQIRFARNYADFRRDARVHKALYAGYDAGYVSNARLVLGFRAIDILAAGLGTEMNAMFLTADETDSDADGTVDSGTYRELGENGLDVLTWVDSDGDGNPESIAQVERSPFGEHLITSTDNDGDAVFDSVLTLEFDIHGQNTLFSSDNDADGQPNYLETYVFDEAGNEIQEIYDSNADSVPDEIRYLEYGENSVEPTVVERDQDADGDIDQTFYNQYDEDGNLVVEEIDTGADGTIDFRNTYTYNEYGDPLSAAYDFDADGTPESIETRTYDKLGNITSTILDTDGDGNPETITENTYDGQGRLTSVVNDADADGAPDFIQTFTYDDEAHTVVVANDTDGDGTGDQFLYSSFNENGDIEHQEIDLDGDGVIDSITDRTFNAGGLPERLESDPDADGTVDLIRTFEYVPTTLLSIATI